MAAEKKPSSVLPLLATATEKLPSPFPVVQAICWALLLTGVAATAFGADRTAEISCPSQCFWSLSRAAIPRALLACGAAQVIAAAVALRLASRLRRVLASASLTAGFACQLLLSTYLAGALFRARDDGIMDIDGASFVLFMMYGAAMGYLGHRGFEVLYGAAEYLVNYQRPVWLK